MIAIINSLREIIWFVSSSIVVAIFRISSLNSWWYILIPIPIITYSKLPCSIEVEPSVKIPHIFLELRYISLTHLIVVFVPAIWSIAKEVAAAARHVNFLAYSKEKVGFSKILIYIPLAWLDIKLLPSLPLPAVWASAMTTISSIFSFFFIFFR